MLERVVGGVLLRAELRKVGVGRRSVGVDQEDERGGGED